MSDKIKILVVEPMKPCEVLELPDTLDAMRQIVQIFIVLDLFVCQRDKMLPADPGNKKRAVEDIQRQQSSRRATVRTAYPSPS